MHPRGLSAVATTPGVTRPVVGIAEFPRFRGQVNVLRPSLSIGADQEAREVNKKVTKRLQRGYKEVNKKVTKRLQRG